MAVTVQRQVITITASDSNLDPEVQVILDCLLPNGQTVQCSIAKEYLEIDDQSKLVFAAFVVKAFAAALAKAKEDYTLVFDVKV